MFWGWFFGVGFGAPKFFGNFLDWKFCGKRPVFFARIFGSPFLGIKIKTG
jgi:hypothetical protein